MSKSFRYLCSLATLFLGSTSVAAHPVPKNSHDRTIVVRLQKPLPASTCSSIVGATSAPLGQGPLLAATTLFHHRNTPTNRIQVRVDYRLEVDEWTVYENDMQPYRDKVKAIDYRVYPMKYYAKFAEIYAPIYASHLVARVDKSEPAEFRCVAHKQTLHDEDGKGLGHLRCDFAFEAMIDLPTDRAATFSFREQNYYLEKGHIVLTLANEGRLAITSKKTPDEALWRRMQADKQEPDDDERLREIFLQLASIPSPAKKSEPAALPILQDDSPTPSPPRKATKELDDWFDLRRLILQTDYGVGLVMLLAFVFGAAHALTPGHGKTLVAAYLVGERGTVWHALYLGLVTTLTHTGVVMLLAMVLTLAPAQMQDRIKAWIENGLGLVMGLIIVCMGFWLLLQRLAGRADHIHLDGGHHHHDGSTHDSRTLGWRGLTLLGITGGMIPCWDAVGVLFITVGTSEIWLVLPAVAVFSAGLAVVLVVIGILIVQVPKVVESRIGNGRVLHALPIVSAILVTLMGLWVCYEGVHGR